MISHEVKFPFRAYVGPALLISATLSVLVFTVLFMVSIYINKADEVSELVLEREKLETRIQQQELDIMNNAQASSKTDAWTLETPTLTLTAVQKKIGELSKISKIELRSFRKTTYSGKQSGQGFDVTVQVEGNASLVAFYEFLKLIELNSPKLFVVDTSVRRLTRQTPDSIYPQVFFILTIVAPMNATQGEN